MGIAFTSVRRFGDNRVSSLYIYIEAREEMKDEGSDRIGVKGQVSLRIPLSRDYTQPICRATFGRSATRPPVHARWDLMHKNRRNPLMLPFSNPALGDPAPL